MNKSIVFGLAFTTAACGGNAEKAPKDSTTPAAPVVQGPPAVPSALPESIRSRPRTTDSPSNSGTKTAPPVVVPSSPAATPAADTVRGIVSVVGTEHEKRVTIAPATGGKRIEVTGALAAMIGHAAATDVWVSGTRSGATLVANRFVVRTVENAPAIDGTLKTESGTLYIVTADGVRTRIVSPPPPLTGRDGSRVWITGDPSRGVQAFGFIDPPR